MGLNWVKILIFHKFVESGFIFLGKVVRIFPGFFGREPKIFLLSIIHQTIHCIIVFANYNTFTVIKIISIKYNKI
jgi:hypothetical protein